MVSNILNPPLRMGGSSLYWKNCYLIPLHKSGNKQLVENYRGIAKLNILPKLFETIVTKQLVFVIISSTSRFQQAFFKGSSTVTTLSEISSHIFKTCSCAPQTDVVYMDNKAFDRVNHKLHLFKLQSSGFLLN